MIKEELNEQLYKAVENGDLEDVIEALKAGAECTRDISSFAEARLSDFGARILGR